MSAANPIWSVEDFLERRFDLPESGQWSELSEGRVVHLQPPDLDHGNALLNLSKLLAEYVQSAQGYACFDLGLLLQRNPDTVWFPAVCYFIEGVRFEQSDRLFTDTVPDVVVELASTPDRRQSKAGRVRRYLQWGAQAVWVVDPSARTLEVSMTDGADSPTVLEADEKLDGDSILSGFRATVGDLFAEPLWWS